MQYYTNILSVWANERSRNEHTCSILDVDHLVVYCRQTCVQIMGLKECVEHGNAHNERNQKKLQIEKQRKYPKALTLRKFEWFYNFQYD